MGKVITKKIQGMSLWAKVSLVTTLTLLVSTFMFQGLYKPATTPATPTISDAWTNVYGATAAAASVNVNSTAFAVTAGTNRLLLVAVQYESGTAGTFSAHTVTYGGVTVNPIATTGATSSRSHTWLGYILDANIPAGSQVVNVQSTLSQTLSGVQIAVASYTGVNQSTPVTTSVQAISTGTTIPFPSAVAYNADSITVIATNNGGSAPTFGMTTVTGGSAFTSQAGAASTGGGFGGFVAVSGTNATASSYTTATTVSYGGTTSTRGSMVVASLNPAVVTPVPTITLVNPNTRVQGTSASVTITGTNLTGGTVTFSNPGVTGGTPTVANATTITLPVTVTPAAAINTGTVTVTTAGGSANSAFSVTGAPTPTVTTTSPNAMTVGTGPTTITINGTNFLTGATVTFSGTGVTAGASTFISATQLTVPVTVTGAAATGARNVTVTLPGGQVSTGGTGAFTVNAAASCTVGARTLTITPNTFVAPGGIGTYTVTVTNGDSGAGCSNLPVTLTRGTPTNTTDFTTSILSKTSLSVPPGGTDFATFTATANVAAANGATSSTTVTSSVTATTPTNVTGTTTVTLFSTPLMHTGANLGSGYSGGTWGAGKDCSWCHATTTTNIKRVKTQIDTPSGVRNVTFMRMTANRTTGNGVNGVFANDNRTYATNASTNVCEVCHHQTTYHQYSSSKIAALNKNHQNANNTDCTSCHKHAAGFGVNSACNACHGYPPGVNGGQLVTPATGSPNAGAHSKHNADRGIVCDTCHNGNTMPSTDNNISIGFNITGSNFPGFPGSITFGTFSGKTLNAPYNFVAGNAGTIVRQGAANNFTCNVYCHGNWAGSNGSKNASWVGGPNEAACGTCHGVSTAPAPNAGSHSRHASAVGGYSYGCNLCHTVPGNNLHVDGNAAWNLLISDTRIGASATYRGLPTGTTTGHFATTPVGTYGACNNVYCHSTAQGANGTSVATYRQVTWGQGTLACNSCHGNDTATLVTGSHSRHLATTHATYGCVNCHSGFETGTGANHVNYVINVQQNLLVGSTGTYTQAAGAPLNGFGTCTASYCHSTVQSATGGTPPTYRTVTWGVGPLTCSSCHGSDAATLTTGTHTAHLNVAGITCANCHGAAGGAGNTAIHANQQIDIVLAAGAYSGDSTPQNSNFGACSATFCHGARTITWGTTLAGTGCAACHSSAVAPFTTFTLTDGSTNTVKSTIHVSHMNRSHTMMTSGTGAIACASCHSVPAATMDIGHIDSALPAEAVSSYTLTGGTFNVTYTGTSCTTYCHGSTLTSNISNPQAGLVLAPTFGTTLLAAGQTTANCVQCHGYPPITASGIHVGRTDCVTCHKHVNATNNGFADPALHINGILEGGTCYDCHSGAAGSTSAPTRRRGIVGQFTSARNSHHYQGPTMTADGAGKNVCFACHWESDATGSTTGHHREQTAGFRNKVQLVVWGTSTTRPTTYTANTTYVLYSSGGTTNSTRVELAKINTHCIGCHNDANKTTTTFLGDTGTPAKYSWEGLTTAKGGFGTVQSIASKYLSTTTTNWGKFAVTNNVNNKQPVIKAFSAHGNASVNQRGWSTLEETWNATAANYPNTSGANSVLCFDCHNSHGSEASQPANAITSSYSSATGNRRGGILKTTVANRGGYTVSYRPYTGGNNSQRNPFKTGAGLCFDCHNNATVGLATSAGYTTPWGYGTTATGGTFGGSAKIHGYNDNPYFGKAGGTFAKGVTYTYLTAGGLTVNKGGHFMASSTLSSTPNRKIGGLCTPCHDPHGVSPGIITANQQFAVPMLKGTYVTSPYKQDAAPVNENEVRGGGCQRAPLTTGSTPGYHIDQNTIGAATAGKPATARYWTFATSATTQQTYNETQFAGLCTSCHNKADINSTATATSATGTDGSWKSMKRIHNSVNGWALTTGTGKNANNVVHAYTCSKCHSTHNSNLPRLLVTNCLDVKHRTRATNNAPVATINTAGSLINTQTGSRGAGLGRFPGGGSYGHSRAATTATNPGPWFFGVRQTTLVTQASMITTNTCHDGATAGGAWNTSGSNQLWNTKSTW